MKILRKDTDQNIIINKEDTFKTDLGWQESAQEMEKELLENIINPVQNFETVRYLHKPYTGNFGILQTDIWFKFWFISGGTYVQDYEPTGLSAKENALMLKQTTESFFRLEFYKTPNGEIPNRTNRRLVFAKNLSLPLGEKYYYSTLNDNIFKPVFMGSNYRNKENMYLFWFQDDTALNEENLTGNTFYMTAKFFNAEDGTITDFTNKDFIGFSSPNPNERVGTRENPILFFEKGINSVREVDEEYDMYYKVVIDRTDNDYGYIYEVFYEVDPDMGYNPPTPTPTPTIPPTPTPSPSVPVTTTPTPTPSSSNEFDLFLYIRDVAGNPNILTMFYSVNGGSPTNIPAATMTIVSLNCTYVLMITGLTSGDSVTFGTSIDCAMVGTQGTSCPSSVFGGLTTYTHNIDPGPNFVSISIDSNILV